jgi:hypothetical protein
MQTQTQTNSALSFVGEIPPFVESAMDALYGSLYATLTHLQLHYATDQASTYARWHEGKLTALFLFRRHGKEVRVINEGMRLGIEEIEKFCEHIFNQHIDTQRIQFHAVQLNEQAAKHPALRFSCTEDIVITLPATKEAYLQQLGKSTRKNLRQHLAKAERNLPGLRYEVVEGKEISEQTIRSIISFNHARMADKQRSSAISGESEVRLLSLIRKRGTVGLLYVNNQVCGGSLACRVGKDLYSLVNAHDPQYNAYSLGNVCRYLMIINAIDKGDERFHMLGGNFSSKASMLGQRQQLDHLVLYRSHTDMLRDAMGITKLSLQSASYLIRNWMQEQIQKKEKSFIANMILSTINILRQMRRRISTIN